VTLFKDVSRDFAISQASHHSTRVARAFDVKRISRPEVDSNWRVSWVFEASLIPAMWRHWSLVRQGQRWDFSFPEA
jgi:hypothetical protein